jgi:hypothetical protein
LRSGAGAWNSPRTSSTGFSSSHAPLQLSRITFLVQPVTCRKNGEVLYKAALWSVGLLSPFENSLSERVE